MKIKLFAVVFLVLLSSYLTRELFPKRTISKPSFNVTTTYRETPPPRLNVSFANTDVLALLEKKEGLINRLKGQVSELSEKLTTRQNLPPDTVYISELSIPSSAIRRGIIHISLSKGRFQADVTDVSDSTAIVSSWVRRDVWNDFEVWAMQDSELLPARWIRLDEKRNIVDIDLLNLGYSYREGLFVDFANLRIFGLHFKGRLIESGIGGEVWFRAF